jgi:hypothetical protein
MNRKEFLPLLIAISLIGQCSLSVAQEAVSTQKTITIALTSIADDKGFDGKPHCTMLFGIRNNSYGTLYYINGDLRAWDDRGRLIDSVLGAGVTNTKGFGTDAQPIAVGATVLDLGRVMFKEECRFIAKIQLRKVSEENCNIRNFPENIPCKNLIRFGSQVPGIRVEQ